jgi:hypothetical protein
MAAVVDGVMDIDIIYVPARGVATDGIMPSVIHGRSEATRCLARGYWFAGKLVSRKSGVVSPARRTGGDLLVQVVDLGKPQLDPVHGGARRSVIPPPPRVR